jgi:hypothetical protein
MTAYVVIREADGLVINRISYEGDDYDPGPGLIVVQSDEAGVGWTYADGVFSEPPPPETPPVVAEPIKVSRLEFRRLLTPVEAARFRMLDATPRLTVEELEQAFDPSTPNPEFQIRAAVEDAIQQWNLLDQGVIELDHADTAEFLMVMGLAGMFGADAQTRIPQILAQQTPG